MPSRLEPPPGAEIDFRVSTVGVGCPAPFFRRPSAVSAALRSMGFKSQIRVDPQGISGHYRRSFSGEIPREAARWRSSGTKDACKYTFTFSAPLNSLMPFFMRLAELVPTVNPALTSC